MKIIQILLRLDFKAPDNDLWRVIDILDVLMTLDLVLE